MTAAPDLEQPTADTPATPARPARSGATRGRISQRLLFAYTWLLIAWLMAPIAVMVAFSFNDTKGRYNTIWQGFTLKWYEDPFSIPDLRDGVINSLIVAVLTMLLAGTLGTLVGLALGKYRFRGQGSTNLVMFAVISSPELVMGAALLALFVSAGVARGIGTILVAHVMFSISFVAVVVRARVLTLDPNLEEAARDLGAGPFTTFRLVTLPMIFPAVLSGGLLAFALSIDDFVITNFTSGTTITFPLWVYGATRLGVPPQVNVMGTLILAVGLVIAVLNVAASRRRARR